MLDPKDYSHGNHSFEIVVTDVFNQSESHTMNFNSYVLRVFCSAIPKYGHTSFQCSSSSNLSSFLCSFDGGPLETCELEFEVAPPQFAVGRHNVVFVASDFFQQTLNLTLNFSIIPGIKFTYTCI